jgi:hypothetical protein
MKKLFLKSLIPLVTPTMIALAIYIAFRPTSVESAGVNYGGGRIVYGGGGGGLTYNDLVIMTNIALFFASSPTGGVSLTAFAQTQFDTNGNQVVIRNGAVVTNLIVLGPDGGAFLTLSNGTFSPIMFFGSGDNDGFVATLFTIGDSLGGNSYTFANEVSTNEFRWLNAAQERILVLNQNRTIGVPLTSNTLVSVAPGGILATTIIGANLSYDAATRTLTGTGGGLWYGQNSATNVIITNSTSSSAASLTISNSTGDQLNSISFYHGSAAPATSLSFDTLVSSNTYRIFPGPLTSFPPFFTMDRMNRNLMLGYGGTASLNSISNVGDVYNVSNTYLLGPVTAGNGIQSTGRFGVANSNAVMVTNLYGVVEWNTSSSLHADANLAHRYVMTNRLTTVTSIVLTNMSPGQELTFVIPGEVGSDNTLTFVAPLGQLFVNFDAYGTAVATTWSLNVSNNNMAEISIIGDRFNGTNILKAISRQGTF